MANDNSFPVVVIGAGLAGLSAAAHLAGRGIEVLVLDEDSLWPGGRLSGGSDETFTYNGREWAFKNEHSVHALWGGYVNMKAMIERFTDTRLQISSGEEWINRWGREIRRIEAGNAVRSRWIPAPFHYLQLLFHPGIWATIQPWDFLSLPGFLASMLLTVGTDPIKEKQAWDGLFMKDFFLGWTPNLRTTFEGLGVNLLAAPGDQITLSSFIAALRFYTVLRRDSWAMAYLPANSHSSLIWPLVEHVERCGGMVKGGATVKKLQQTEHGWQITVEDDERQGRRSLNARNVILAVNAPAAERLLKGSPDTRQRASEMFFPDGLNNAVVRLWFDAEPRPGTAGGMLTGDYGPDNFFWLHRLYDDYAAWHRETGGSAIELHYYEEHLLDVPDRNLIVDAVTEVQRTFPEVRGHFVHGYVRRNSKTQTLFRVPTGDALHVNTGWDRLYACGDWIGHDTPSFWMERATTTGIAAANEVLQALEKEPYPILYPPKPELPARGLGGLVKIGRKLFSPIMGGLRRLRG